MLPLLLALLIFGSSASAQDVGRAALDAANQYLLLVNQGASTVPRCPFTEEFIYLFNSCTFLPDRASLGIASADGSCRRACRSDVCLCECFKTTASRFIGLADELFACYGDIPAQVGGCSVGSFVPPPPPDLSLFNCGSGSNTTSDSPGSATTIPTLTLTAPASDVTIPTLTINPPITDITISTTITVTPPVTDMTLSTITLTVPPPVPSSTPAQSTSPECLAAVAESAFCAELPVLSDVKDALETGCSPRFLLGSAALVTSLTLFPGTTPFGVALGLPLAELAIGCVEQKVAGAADDILFGAAITKLETVCGRRASVNRDFLVNQCNILNSPFKRRSRLMAFPGRKRDICPLSLLPAAYQLKAASLAFNKCEASAGREAYGCVNGDTARLGRVLQAITDIAVIRESAAGVNLCYADAPRPSRLPSSD